MAATVKSREFDVIILGASGFTGKYVVREALKFLSSASGPLRSLALAGRSPSKLAAALQWAAAASPPPPLSLISADVFDPTSLLALCRSTRIILNCVGPFHFYGDPVVAACVEAGTDYLDITGEPEFIERTETRYHVRAEKAGSLVVSACGFDSVLAELGLMFHSRQWVPPAVPNRVEAYLSVESERSIVLNIGTYESAVVGMANMGRLLDLRRSRPKSARPVIVGRPPAKGPLIEHNKTLGLWAIKLPSVDAAVVRRTHAILAEHPHGLAGVNESDECAEKRKLYWSTVKPIHFGVKICAKSILGILRLIVTGLFLGLFGMFALGRSILLKFPSVFSLGWFRKTGPTEEEVRSASFIMWFIGHGYSDGNLASQRGRKPDTEIITRVSGPEVGYVTTPIILLQCALVVLSERDNLPKGGVLPPGIVFSHTNLQRCLEENGIFFDVISVKPSSLH
ncbi:probable mitochondrial saccharopine dehydrogenase-like oxidoreductase At5g39410 [Musa acuminata AAA Group]|uniref:probable mitochondrial saccharopine dehydrogenase-like oxidoreductase At5g39410 n=1 Tax=Musa acuminata AAA Group TaxID=214697 RepID=UPI0031DCB814